MFRFDEESRRKRHFLALLSIVSTESSFVYAPINEMGSMNSDKSLANLPGANTIIFDLRFLIED